MCRIDYADDDGGMWLVRPAPRKAVKSHKCGDCGRTILPGERYDYGKYLYDGYISEVKECGQCHAAGRWLVKVCGGYLIDGVNEELAEHWDEEYQLRSNGLRWLIVAGRQRWRREYGHRDLISVEEVSRWVDKALAKVPAEATR